MRKEIIVFLGFGGLALVFWLNCSSPSRQIVRWMKDSPFLLQTGSTGMSAVFSIDSAAVIYWRILPESASPPKFYDFTNTNTEGCAAYGGGFLPTGGSYTNTAAGLHPETGYILYAAALPLYTGVRGAVQRLPFKTKGLED